MMKKSLAGIIPIAGPKTDIEMPWHHTLMPFDKNKVLVQNSVYTCAMAGCESIWIVCNDDMQPLIRSIVGNEIQDPVYRHRSFAKFAKDHQRPIPIFYMPLPLRDMQKRNNYAWSAMHGCLMANKIFGQISAYLAPEQFFISWPYAIVDSQSFREYRHDIKKKTILFDFNGKNIFTNEYVPLVCNIDEVIQVKEYCYELQNPYSSNKNLTHLHPSELLAPLRGKEIVNIDCNYKRVSSWGEYVSLLAKKSIV